MSAHPLITVGITCYREGDWLLECWRSVLEQTDDRWTAVLVMDGIEHQRTRAIFEELNHPKLRKYTLPRRMGPYRARNKAFELTDTPYHFYLDADDHLAPNAVALALETFARHPDAGVVYGDIQTFGNDTTRYRLPPSYAAQDFSEVRAPTGAGAYDIQLWWGLGGFSMELADGKADRDFLIGALEAGIVARHCGGILVHCRKGSPGKVSESYAMRLYEKNEIIVRRHARFFRGRARRHSFLAAGYKTSALAYYQAGDLHRASSLAGKALRFGKWYDLAVWSALLAWWLPRTVYRSGQRIVRFGRTVFGYN